MIRRGAYKYICCDTEQLFDLQNDPHERNNLVDDPDAMQTLQAFRGEAAMRWDIAKITAQVITSQQRRRFIASAHKQGKTPLWDHQPIFDASQMYMRNHIDLDDLEASARFPRVKDEL